MVYIYLPPNLTHVTMVYLRGTTYLRMPLLGMIPVVTLFVVCAAAVVGATNAR